jgi:lysozyme
MSGIDIDRLAEQLKVDEGYRAKVYTCSAGKLTVGYGWNLEDNNLPETVGHMLLDHGIIQAMRACEKFDWFDGLSGIRKEVIINMVYNLGFTGVSKFKNMIKAIEAEDWIDAGYEMLDSKWHNDVGERAERLAKMMVTSS